MQLGTSVDPPPPLASSQTATHSNALHSSIIESWRRIAAKVNASAGAAKGHAVADETHRWQVPVFDHNPQLMRLMQACLGNAR